MRILIIKLGAIGDVIRTTSILQGLHDKYSPDQIDWLTLPKAKDILLNNPLISKIFTWEERKELHDYDLVVSLEDDFEAAQLATSLKPQKLIGTYIKQGNLTYTPSAWFDMSYISRFGLEKANELKKKNRKTFQQHMGDLLDIRVGQYIFKLTADEVEYGRKYVQGLGIGSGGKGERIIGINTGAGKRWQLKALGVEQTIELVNMLKKKLGVVCLILGGPDEQERNEIISKATGMPNAGVHSLRHFASIINQTQLLVSSDSLAMHFAIALGKKTVVFFGPTSSAEIELYGLGSKVDSGMDCLVCYKKQCDKQDNCIFNLPVEKIFEEIKRWL